MTKTEKTQTEASARPRRSPLAGKQRLSVKNKEDGYVYRIVNANLESDPDRVENLIEQGYEIVPKDKLGPVGDKRVDNASAPGSASQISVGQGTKAVVMRQKKDWYDEDQAVKQAQLNAVEQTMKKAKSDFGDVIIS